MPVGGTESYTGTTADSGIRTRVGVASGAGWAGLRAHLVPAAVGGWQAEVSLREHRGCNKRNTAVTFDP